MSSYFYDPDAREALEVVRSELERHEEALRRIANRSFTGTWREVAEQQQRDAERALYGEVVSSTKGPLVSP